MPLALMIIVLSLIALVSLRFGLRVVTGSLQGLAAEANRIAQEIWTTRYKSAVRMKLPNSAEPLSKCGLGCRRVWRSIGSCWSVKAASSLEMQDAVKPVLEAILSTGANSVRGVIAKHSSRYVH